MTKPPSLEVYLPIFSIIHSEANNLYVIYNIYYYLRLLNKKKDLLKKKKNSIFSLLLSTLICIL